MNGQRVSVLEPRKVVVEAFDIPEVGAGEVLIQTLTTLISPGTERAFFLALPTTNASYPFTPGYSNIGEVIALGDGVTHLQVGDVVASVGAHQSHVVLPANQCVKVPAELADEKAVFFNLITIAMQAVHKLRIELGESALVLGMGPIGLFAAQLARIAGAVPVIAVDQDESRLSLAESVGIDAALVSDDELAAKVAELCDADGASVVIEATGSPKAVVPAFQLAATKGRVVLLGSLRGETESVNFYRDVHRKGLTIIGGHEITRPLYENSPGWWTQHSEHKLAIKLLAMNRLSVEPLITHRYTVQEFPQAYDVLASWDKSAMGMIVDWTS